MPVIWFGHCRNVTDHLYGQVDGFSQPPLSNDLAFAWTADTVLTLKGEYMSEKILHLTTQIVCGYVAENHHRVDDLPDLIKAVFDALAKADEPVQISTPSEEPAKPTPQAIRKSINPEYLVSFADGKRYRTLRRHLATHNLDPDSYRAKFGLPADYPMVAPAYSAKRSELAKAAGLGQQRHKDQRQPDPVEAPGKTAPTLDEVVGDKAPAPAAVAAKSTKPRKKAAAKAPATKSKKAPKKRAAKVVEPA